MKGVITVIFLLTTLLPEMLSAQATNAIKAWIELELKDGKTEITGLFRNDANDELTYSYSLELSKTSSSGTAKNKQSGIFTSLPGETNILSRSSFFTQSTQSYRIFLYIYDELGVVFSDSLIYPTTIQNNSNENVDTEIEKPVADLLKKVKPDTIQIIASQNKPQRKTPVDFLEIDGLIIDETRSKIGRDFYDLFYKKWIAPADAKNYSIFIKELPSRGRGARISILVNDQEIFQRFVPPSYDQMESVVNSSIRFTRSRLKALKTLQKQLGEDSKGSGIF